MKRALITGITGQDGRYLAELLLAKGYEVFGLVRRSPVSPAARDAEPLDARIALLEGDLRDAASLRRALEAARPDEIYNLGAQTQVKGSWEDAEACGEITGLGAVRLLEETRRAAPRARFFQASTAEMFGHARETPQTEATPLDPRSPYGIAKAYAHGMTRAYREAHGLFACSGILFNHESPRRRREFVTRKITRAAARIQLGLERELPLGNLDARRDFGFAGDAVRAMWLALQAEAPDDYVIATGEAHSVRDCCQAAFGAVGLDWRDFVRRDERLLRPADAPLLVGDARRARERLGWEPEVGFDDLIRTMVAADLTAAAAEKAQR